jgi:hypothetical protein
MMEKVLRWNMKCLILCLIILVQLLALLGCSVQTRSEGSGMPENKAMLQKLDGNSISTAELEAFVEQIME